MHCRFLSIPLAFVALLGFVQAAESVDYATQVKPLLETKCYACHSVLKQEADLRLDARSLMVQSQVVVPSEPDASPMLQRVQADDATRMPPAEDGARLKPAEIALLRQWIASGANAPDEVVAQSPKDHWAFQPVIPVTVSDNVQAGESTMGPIDRMLLAKQQARGLKRQSPAPRTTQIRRLYLDLIGLPPTLEQLRDQRPWEEIVDELLASPHHGERWARHWMDVWRYSDWYGLGSQLRYSQKHLWHWRDWIVHSLNSDKGYDRMIVEMLAGDELDPTNPDVVAGTGFLARNYYLFNRTTWLDSTIEHTGKAFLGLTLNCAKCHDHKYDPISQVDYYSFRAIFEPHQVRLDPLPGTTDLEQDGLPRVFDDQLDATTFLHVRGDPKNPNEQMKIEPRVPELFVNFQPEIESISLPVEAYAPGLRDYVQQDQLHAARQQVTAAADAVEKARKAWTNRPQQAVAAVVSQTSGFTLEDDFDKPQDDTWQIVGTGWHYERGKLIQSQATRDKEFARLKRQLPRDFDLTCKYTKTGGTVYKSVTFRFDESEDGKFANFVYTSAHAPGPKVQVAFTRDGTNQYPPTGQAGREITVGQQYKLRFAVRDRLVNVWLDDEFVVAYQLPSRRQGWLSISGFDCTVAFDSISIRELPETVQLKAPAAGLAEPAEDLETAAKVAEARLNAATKRLAAVQAVIDADRSKFATPGNEDFGELSKQAARLQAEASLAEAQYELLAAGKDSKKASAAKAKEKAAREQLERATGGDAQYAAFRVSRKALETPAHKESDYPATYPPESTGRRLALARWITSRQNPLTARVAVNHIWMRHFGTPLVESVFDFGLRSAKPLHVDVLDYLANELMNSEWSFKHLHRLIVTSDVYRLSSSQAAADEDTVRLDDGNSYYWRMPTRRMESQVVRDSLLHLAGVLDLQLGGPSVDVGTSSRRRSLYFKHSRDDHDKFLSMFDDADLLQCYRRSESIVPQQALALANSELAMTLADTIARRIDGTLNVAEAWQPTDQNRFVDTAFEWVLGRSATAQERHVCLEFWEQMMGLRETGRQDPLIRTRLVHSLLNHNDFVTIR